MLDSSIVATSLFTIAAEFGDASSINWVALAYTLTYLSCAVLFARVSDVVGRRAAFAAAYLLFIVFSIACGFARGMGQLIAFRALQGVGGSGESFFFFLLSLSFFGWMPRWLGGWKVEKGGGWTRQGGRGLTRDIGLYSVSMIILPEVTPDRAKKHIAAVVGCVLATSGVLGPVLGGVLTQYTSWRWVFWIKYVLSCLHGYQKGYCSANAI